MPNGALRESENGLFIQSKLKPSDCRWLLSVNLFAAADRVDIPIRGKHRQTLASDSFRINSVDTKSRVQKNKDNFDVKIAASGCFLALCREQRVSSSKLLFLIAHFQWMPTATILSNNNNGRDILYPPSPPQPLALIYPLLDEHLAPINTRYSPIMTTQLSFNSSFYLGSTRLSNALNLWWASNGPLSDIAGDYNSSTSNQAPRAFIHQMVFPNSRHFGDVASPVCLLATPPSTRGLGLGHSHCTFTSPRRHEDWGKLKICCFFSLF